MQLFISYARKDASSVNQLEQMLEANGHRVWYDQELHGGEPWWDGILTQIENCDVFIFVLSPASAASPACQTEYGYAQALSKPILPLMVEAAELPNPALRDTQYIDARRLTSRDTERKINASLNHLQTQLGTGQYAAPDEPPPRPTFPHHAYSESTAVAAPSRPVIGRGLWTGVAILVLLVAVATLALQMLVGADDDPDEEGGAVSVAAIETETGRATLPTLIENRSDYGYLRQALANASPQVQNLFQQADGDFTVFAPTDAAFERSADAFGVSINDLLSNRDLVDAILLHHVVPQALPYNDLIEYHDKNLVMASGDAVYINLDIAGIVSLGNATSYPSWETDQTLGVLYEIDDVLVSQAAAALLSEG